MTSQQNQTLTQGNRLYLYRLLRDSIGTGRQTFITQVEEALAADGLDAAAIGFEDARALMEALDEFVALTVFKGGRVYVTLTAQPAWDEALDAFGSGTATKGGDSGKPWKRKKGPRGMKPVRPPLVKRDEPDERADADEATQPDDAADEANAGITPETVNPAGEPDAAAAKTSRPGEDPSPNAIEGAPGSSERSAEGSLPANDAQPGEDVGSPAAPAQRDEAVGEAGDVPEADAPARAPEQPASAYSLTVVYDPEHANAGITTLESTPGAHGNSDQATPDPDAPASTVPEDAGHRACAAHAEPPAHQEADGASHVPEGAEVAPGIAEPAPEPPARTAPAAPPAGKAPEPATVPAAGESPTSPKPAAAVDLRDYPQNFAEEVYCPAPLLRELATLLPLGADALGIAGEYFYLACERGTAELGRGRAAFPLRYLRDGSRRTAIVRIKRQVQGAGTAGNAWAIESVEPEAD